MHLRHIIIESIRSGTIAAIAMMPVGFAFRAAGLRVGHYGPKFASLFVSDPAPPILFAQHIFLGWVSALPLVLFLLYWPAQNRSMLYGAAYGVLYYVLVNSLALPMYFGDELPWGLGIATITPSLVTHIVFGVVIGYFYRTPASLSYET